MEFLTLIDRLAPHVQRQVNLITNSAETAEAFSHKLTRLQEGLQIAEKQGATDPSVHRWLKDLEDVMYQMDDVLDHWHYLDLHIIHDLHTSHHPLQHLIISLFHSLCHCFGHVATRREILQTMDHLTNKFDHLLQERNKFNFVSNTSILPAASQEFRPVESISLVNASRIIGRDSVKNSLVKRLLSNVPYTRFIPVVGAAGVGKTALAQLVFTDARMRHFGLKAWVSVPDPCDALGIAKAILEAADDDISRATSTLNQLARRLKNVVSKKRFLLVLDNMSTEDRSICDFLNNCLCGETASVVLVTTESKEIARMMSGDDERWEHLNLLSDRNCLKILEDIALVGRSEEAKKKFRGIGLEIAKRCKGLPLAAKTIGSMLASRQTMDEWIDVLQSPLWKYADELSDLFRLLKLSYIDLPPVLKGCFLSCAIFPKGSKIELNMLIRIWMAQGYLSSTESFDEVWLKGLRYFQMLSARSFFQDVDESGRYCKMHDIMHDFATYLANNEYSFILDGTLEKRNNFSSKRGRLAMPLHAIEARERVRFFSARSLTQEALPSHHHLIYCLRSVRVLCLSDCGMKEVPRTIGKLIHLRYLDLSHNDISKLPETIYDLYNLQTLNVGHCSHLQQLPNGIEKLVNLRHLIVSTWLKEFPQGLQKLTRLWTLNEFVATRDSVAYLGNLNQLHGCLTIKFERLNGTRDLEEAKKANLREKHDVRELTMFFNENVSMEVIEAMIPPPKLEILIVGNRSEGEVLLPSWMSSFSAIRNLTKLSISKFSSRELPSLGKLPLLEQLYINVSFKMITMEFLGIGNDCSGGGFPRLKILHFLFCDGWEEWKDVVEDDEVEGCLPILPCLEVLKILYCHELMALPHNLLRSAKSLRNLSIVGCRFLESRYNPKWGEDWSEISYIPNVDFTAPYEEKCNQRPRSVIEAATMDPREDRMDDHQFRSLARIFGAKGKRHF